LSSAVVIKSLCGFVTERVHEERKREMKGGKRERKGGDGIR
jgi:hypothetical protein